MEFVVTNVLGKWHDLEIPERKRLTSIRMDVECSGPSESWLALDICELNRVFPSAFNISFGLIGRGTIEFQLPNLIAELLRIRVDPNTIVRGVKFELERFMPKYVSAYQSWGDNPPVGPVFSESMESRLDRLAIVSVPIKPEPAVGRKIILFEGD